MNASQNAAGPAGGGTSDPRRWKALALLCTAQFLVLLDSSIVSLALPSIEQDLGFTNSGVQWLVSAYLISFGGLLLLGGRTADLVRRRRLFVIGTVLFAVASLMCGLAWDPGSLIVFRVIQGAAAAFMSPTALSIVATTFTDGAERNKALGIWAGTAGFGASAGLLVGGPITEGLGWQWIFYLSVPIAAVLVVLAPSVLQESAPRTGRRHFDPAGAATITLALVAGVFGISTAPTTGWLSTQTIVSLGLAVVLAALFVVVERRTAEPLVPLGVFRSRTVVGGTLNMIVLGVLAFGITLPLTLYAQQVLHYSPLVYGLGTIVMTAGTVVGSMAGQNLVAKLGFRPLAAAGMLLTAVGCLLLAQVTVGGTYFGDLFFGLLVFGPGLGAGVVASYIAMLTGVPPEQSGLVSGINTAAFQIGGALGVAVVSTVVTSYTADPAQLESLTSGFRAGFAACAVCAVLGIVIALVLFRPVKNAGTGQGAPDAETVREPALD
jgi:EmrB/QacA subfamily drug resistance transporter